MTLIQVTHSDGTSRRCDARCYGAKNQRCHCVCGGAKADAYLTAQLGPDWKVRFLAGHEQAAGQVSAA